MASSVDDSVGPPSPRRPGATSTLVHHSRQGAAPRARRRVDGGRRWCRGSSVARGCGAQPRYRACDPRDRDSFDAPGPPHAVGGPRARERSQRRSYTPSGSGGYVRCATRARPTRCPLCPAVTSGCVEHVEQEPEVRRRRPTRGFIDESAARRRAQGTTHGPRRARSPSRAAGRSRARPRRPRGAGSTRRPAARAGRAASIRPLVGRNPPGSSAYTRASMACPRNARRPARSPAARRPRSQLSPTRSRPVTASVTGCSTCSRAFSSRKRRSPSGSSRNSAVPAPA